MSTHFRILTCVLALLLGIALGQINEAHACGGTSGTAGHSGDCNWFSDAQCGQAPNACVWETCVCEGCPGTEPSYVQISYCAWGPQSCTAYTTGCWGDPSCYQ